MIEPGRHAHSQAIKVEVCQRYGWIHILIPSRPFFAADSQGHILWVKACVAREYTSSSWNWYKTPPTLPFAAMIGILVSSSYELLHIIRVPHAAVERLKHENQDTFRLRWNAETAHDREVEILWSKSSPS